MVAPAPEPLGAATPHAWVSAPELGVLSTTVATEAQAQAIAQALVQQHLAACVHLHAVASVYAWQGHVQQDAEWALRIKTTPARLPEVLAWLRAHHPYEVPELIWQRAEGASASYGEWLQEQCAGPSGAQRG